MACVVCEDPDPNSLHFLLDECTYDGVCAACYDVMSEEAFGALCEAHGAEFIPAHCVMCDADLHSPHVDAKVLDIDSGICTECYYEHRDEMFRELGLGEYSQIADADPAEETDDEVEGACVLCGTAPGDADVTFVETDEGRLCSWCDWEPDF